MHSLSPAFIASLSFGADQLATLQAIGTCRGRQELLIRQTPELLESLRQAAIMESIESSNRLEGITAPRDRIEALVLKPGTPRNRAEQEIAGYRDALNLIHESYPSMEFTTNVILQVHALANRYMVQAGGRWKLADHEIEETQPDDSQRIRFRPVPASQIPQAMEALVTQTREALLVHQIEPLVVVPLALLDFLCIHPFANGNGRVGRLLTLLLLYRLGLQVGRYVSLERIIEESKETCYQALETSSQDWHQSAHDARPWLAYFWGVLLRAYREGEERSG